MRSGSLAPTVHWPAPGSASSPPWRGALKWRNSSPLSRPSLSENLMKRTGILNLPLSQAIAAMGHGDLMIVCDAGFPIPSEVPRVDLALARDVPDLETVLTLIQQDFIAEKVGYAAEMA